MVASMEAALELWASSLRDVKARIRPLFTQARVAQSAGLFLDSLLGPERRKTGWMRAEAAGDPGPWRQQAILGRSRWKADALRDIVRAYALEVLADPQAVLVIDEPGFLKQGKSSCGVGRQYTGLAGKIDPLPSGRVRGLCVPARARVRRPATLLAKAWAGDAARRAAAQAPSEVAFATKPHIAVQVIGRTIAANVPFAWVAADTVYGVGEVEMALRRAGKGYVLGVGATSQFNSWGAKPLVVGTAEGIARNLDASAWAALVRGRGRQGRAPARLGLP